MMLKCFILFILFATQSLNCVNGNNPQCASDFFSDGALAWEVDNGTTRIIRGAPVNFATNTISAGTTLSDTTKYSFAPQVSSSTSEGSTVAWITLDKVTGQRFIAVAIFAGGSWTQYGIVSLLTDDVLPNYTLKASLNGFPITIVYRAIDLNTNQVVLREINGNYQFGNFVVTNVYPFP